MAWDTSAQIRRVLTQKCAIAGIPVSGTFELTPRCNLSCRMCYVRLTPKQMMGIGRERTAEEWIEFAKEAKDAGMTFLLLTGGEPTLRRDFCEIYEELAKMGLSISINTNGTMFSDKLCKLMHYLPPAQINITLYGVSEQDYGELCGDESAYERVVDTIHWLKAENILTHLNATMTPTNINHWEKYEEFAQKENLELRMTAYCFPPVRRSDCREFERLTPEIAGELMVKDLMWREGIEAVRKRAKTLESPLNSCKLDLGDPIQCMAAKSQFWINWDGTMVPCGMLKYPMTRPFENGFTESWQKLKEEAAKIRLCPECAGCSEKKHCMNCAAVTYTETGDFAGKPEYMCRFNQSYREALKKYSV